jgi:hypothetical protein
MTMPSGNRLVRGALVVAAMLLMWIVLRMDEAPFATVALLYDVSTDSMYQVELTPALGLDATKRLWLGFSWRDRRVIDEVVARGHLPSALETAAAWRQAMEHDPERFFDSLLIALRQQADSISVAMRTRSALAADSSLSEKGWITFTRYETAPLPTSLLTAFGDARLTDEDLVPVTFTMERHTVVWDPRMPAEERIKTVEFEVLVVDRGILIRGNALRALYERGLWPLR